MPEENNILDFKTEDPEIEELQKQSKIFLDLCSKGKMAIPPSKKT